MDIKELEKYYEPCHSTLPEPSTLLTTDKALDIIISYYKVHFYLYF